MIYKVNVLNRPMCIQTKKILPSLLIAVISVNFILYASQRYSPPRADSKSYSVLRCPYHESTHGVPGPVHPLTDSEQESGSEKNCFLYSCKDRALSVLSVTGTLTAALEPAGFLGQPHESRLTEDIDRNVPVRSPPSYLS